MATLNELRELRRRIAAEIATCADHTSASALLQKRLDEFAAEGASQLLEWVVCRSVWLHYRAEIGAEPDATALEVLNESLTILRSLGIEPAKSRLSLVCGWLQLHYGQIVANSGEQVGAAAWILQGLQSVYRPEDEDRTEFLLSAAEVSLEAGMASQSQRLTLSCVALKPPIEPRQRAQHLLWRTALLTGDTDAAEALGRDTPDAAPAAADRSTNEPGVSHAQQVHNPRHVGRLHDKKILTADWHQLLAEANTGDDLNTSALSLLRLYALDKQHLLDALPRVNSLVQRNRQVAWHGRRRPALLRGLQVLEQGYDRKIPLSTRLRQIAEMLPEIERRAPIEVRILFLAAVVRLARRSNQSELAELALASCKQICLSLSQGSSSDTLELNLDSERSTDRFAPFRDRPRGFFDLLRLAGSVSSEVISTRIRMTRLDQAQREREQTASFARLGEKLFDELATYRGGLMKLGQMLSLVPSVPTEMRLALSALRYDARPTPFSQIEEALSTGVDPNVRERLLIDPQPLAVGSIAQIHTALLDQRQVVLKIRHPGIVQQLEHDLRLAGLVKPVLRRLLPRADINGILAELGDRIHDEVNFKHEADVQRRLQELWGSYQEIVIPSVSPESTADVLIMEQISGQGFPEFAATATAEERNAAGVAIVLFSFRSLFKLGIFNGDPHPGNFLFMADGRVAFLDFGFSKQFATTEVELWRETLTATLANDAPTFAKAIRQLGMVANEEKFNFAEHWQLNRAVFAPILTGEDFTFTPDFVQSMIALHFVGSNAAHVSPPPSSLVLWRIVFGLYGLLAELRATAAWRSVIDRALA